MKGSASTLRAVALFALPYLAALTPLVLYQALYVNGFYPITEGWFSEYAHLIRTGAVPYRDFSLLLTPLYPMQLAVFQAFFGDGLLPLHILGIFVTSGIAIALFELLRPFFNPWICAFAAALGTIYYQSGNAFIDYDFTQFVTLYLLIATALLVHSVRARAAMGSEPRALWLCGGSGFFLSLALLIKQSNGGVGALAVILASAVVALVLYRLRAATLRIAAQIVGFCLPIAAVLVWLGVTGALRQFVADVIVAALHAKGGLSIFMWLGYYVSSLPASARQLTTYLLQILFIMLIGPIILELVKALWNRRPFDRVRLMASLRRIVGPRKSLARRAFFVSTAGLAILCFLVLAVAHGFCKDCGSRAAVMMRDAAYTWSPNFYAIGAVVALVFLLTLRRPSTARFFVIAALGVGLTFGNGMSAGLSEISTFLGVTILFAFLIDIGLAYLFPVAVPVALGLAFCAFFIESKFDAPYTWWQVTTPPVGSTPCADASGILRGLCIPPHAYASIMSIKGAILTNTSPGQAIYVYPHMPIFYLLTNRAPFDNAVVSWFDATSDKLADSISRDLRTDPPAVIVMAEIPDDVLVAHEQLFRGGRPLRQRKILASIAYLRSKGLLQRVERVKDLNGLTIDVFRAAHR